MKTAQQLTQDILATLRLPANTPEKIFIESALENWAKQNQKHGLNNCWVITVFETFKHPDLGPRFSHDIVCDSFEEAESRLAEYRGTMYTAKISRKPKHVKNTFSGEGGAGTTERPFESDYSLNGQPR